MNLQIESSNPVVRAVIEGNAPRPARLAAARGLLPLPPKDLMEILAAFAAGDDAELSQPARETLQSQDETIVESIISGEDAPLAVLRFFAFQPTVVLRIYEAILRNPKTPRDLIEEMARTTERGDLLELISLNQQLLIKAPSIIEAIIGNPNGTSEAHRRAAETKREFFEKERGAQQIANELKARGMDAAAEFFNQADLTDSDLAADDAFLIASMIEVPDSETDDSWMGLEFIEEIYEESPEQRSLIAERIIGEFKTDDSEISAERISVINRIMKMSMKDRMRLAMKGDREARNILIRDPNRIVCQAVVNNPRITEQEVEKIATMRSITEDVLRQLANNRQWQRSYSIIHNLARNPRTPIANVLPILTRLQLRDLIALSKNKNVSDAVRRQALRLTQTRAGK
ncbi:MAG TPA: hypothetical protein DEA22_03990 [Blastocatellia bacterium]|nr:hypothetical protein [Blastocatellia bacterium]